MSSSNALPRAILWDMDGTLIDTERLWAQATFELSEQLGRRLSVEERAKTEGGSFTSTLQIVARWAGVTVSARDELLWKRWMDRRMQQLFATGVELNPGVGSLLQQFRSLGIPMAIATNTDRHLADFCIQAIGREFFDVTVAGDEVPCPKPAPDIYHKAATLLGTVPENCLVIEDSWTGMTAGVCSGAVVIGLADRVPDLAYAAGRDWLSRVKPSDFFALFERRRT